MSPAKQFYHCFGCGAHGSAIGFLMNYDRLEFPDAVEELASRAGLKVPYEGGREAPREDATDLYNVLDAAASFYPRAARREATPRARISPSRGLDDATLARFNLGYAPDQWDALKNALGTSAQRIALLEKAGMLTSGERGSKYDRFRHRVMFPILDRRGRTIAFGGRVLVKEDTPKYLNSPETPLFHKGRELFGLWQVREAHQKIPRLIVVEGYMDVISLHQFGVTQAVATLGTATTRDHAEILFRQCADVYFCFDGDRAGRQAAWRAVESVLPRMRDGRQALFLFLPDGEDPDTLIRKEGSTGFEQRLKNATPLSEFFFAEIGKDVNLASLDGKARLAERARPLLAQIPDGAFRDLMLGRARPADRRARAGRRARDRCARAIEVRRAAAAAIARALRGRAARADAAARSAIEPPWTFAELRQPGIPLLVELIALCRDRPEITTGALLEHFAEREEAKALQKLAVMDFPGGEDESREEFLGAIAAARSPDRIAAPLGPAAAAEGARSAKASTGLTEAERNELRQLLDRRRKRASAMTPAQAPLAALAGRAIRFVADSPVWCAHCV